jgi:hypothetical protein
VAYKVQLPVDNCDIEFFIFCHRFCILRLKFPKFKTGQNAAEIFCIGNNISEELQKSIKLDKISFHTIYYHKILLDFVKFHVVQLFFLNSVKKLKDFCQIWLN